MKQKSITRNDKLLPKVDGRLIPRWLRVYDNGGNTTDRFTIVFTTRIPRGLYVHCCEAPDTPQGVWSYNTSEHGLAIDRPTYGHLGKRIKFEALPERVYKYILVDYADVWDINLREWAEYHEIDFEIFEKHWNEIVLCRQESNVGSFK